MRLSYSHDEENETEKKRERVVTVAVDRCRWVKSTAATNLHPELQIRCVHILIKSAAKCCYAGTQLENNPPRFFSLFADISIYMEIVLWLFSFFHTFFHLSTSQHANPANVRWFICYHLSVHQQLTARYRDSFYQAS